MAGGTTSWALAVTLTASALSVLAQQDNGPILRPRKPTTEPAVATLLVLCDMTCDWTLDGNGRGRIFAGESAKVKVKVGQHVVLGATEDGLDQIQQLAEVEGSGQTVVTLQLKPVLDARLKAEQAERIRQALEQEEKQRVKEQAERDREARDQKERERAAREQVGIEAKTLYRDGRFAEAVPLLDKSCSGGDGEACEKLGSVYDEGKGTAKEYARAAALFSKSCDAGSAEGCARLGTMYVR